MSTARRNRTWQAAAWLVAAAGPAVARAATYTWTGNLQPAVGAAATDPAFDWDATYVVGGSTVTNWADGLIPVGGTDTQLVFSAASAAVDAAHAANHSPYQDVAPSGFVLNQLTFGGDAFTLNGGPLAFANSSSGAGAAVQQNAAADQTVDESITFRQPLTLGGTGTGTVTLAGYVGASPGPGVITVAAAGTYVLSGDNANLYASEVLTSGTLALAGPLALGVARVRTGAGITFNGGTLQYRAAGVADYSALMTTAGAASYDVDTDGQAVTFANGLGGSSAGLVKRGAGTLTLAGASTYGGATNVSGGTVAVPAGGSIGTPAAAVRVDGSAATLGVAGGTVAASTLYAGYAAAGAVSQSAGGVTVATAVDVAYSAGSTGTYTLSGGTLDTPQVNVGYGGTGAVLQAGGTVTTPAVSLSFLSGAGTYTLGGGVLSTGRVNKGKGTGTLYFNGGTLRSTADATTFVFGLTAAIVQGGGAVIDTNGHADSISQALVHDPSLGTTVDGGLTKAGDGTLTLGGNNTYTGPTNVSGGTLRVSTAGSPNVAIGPGPVNVLPGGTLGGSGTIGNASTGTVTVAGTITGGASDTTVGTLVTGPESWVSGGTFLVKALYPSAGSDKLVMSGLSVAATPDARFGIAFSASSATTAGTTAGVVLAYDQDPSSTSNPFASSSVLAELSLTTVNYAAPPGYDLTLATQADASNTGYDLVLRTVATPEPTSLALLAAAAAPLTLRRRRARHAGR